MRTRSVRVIKYLTTTTTTTAPLHPLQRLHCTVGPPQRFSTHHLDALAEAILETNPWLEVNILHSTLQPPLS
jgi:hypothetical protein